MTVYSLDILSSPFGTCLLFHVRFWLASWPAYRFLRRQERWYSFLFKNFPQFVLIHTVKSFTVVSETEIDVFMQFPCFFYDPTDVGDLISGSSAFSKSSLNIGKFLVHVLLKPSFKDFKHYLASMWNDCSCVIVWTFSGIAVLWDWSENWTFPVL